MKIVPSPQKKTTNRSRKIAQTSVPSRHSRVQWDRAVRAVNSCRQTDKVACAHPVESGQSGVTGQPEFSGCGILANQPMQDQATIFTAQQNGSTSKVSGLERANLHGFLIANRWSHAGTSRLEANRRVLLQQGQHHFLSGTR